MNTAHHSGYDGQYRCITDGEGASVVHAACWSGKTKELWYFAKLLRQDLNDIATCKGSTSLHAAVQINCEEADNVILAQTNEIDVLGNSERTLFMLALNQRQLDAAALIFRRRLVFINESQSGARLNHYVIRSCHMSNTELLSALVSCILRIIIKLLPVDIKAGVAQQKSLLKSQLKVRKEVSEI